MFGSSSGTKGLNKQLFNLKMTAKQLNRLSDKCGKDEKVEKDKIKKALEKDNHDGARIHAQNAIRNQNNAQNYLRLASRVDAVSSRLESAIKMQEVTATMGGVVKGMDKALSSMNVDQISKVMGRFEQSFENTDVRAEYIENAMNSTTTSMTPEEEVESLMGMVAEQHGLEMKEDFKSASPQALSGGVVAAALQLQAASGGGGGGGDGGGTVEDDLEERLRRLRS
jgi:charged multivesicular body protein 1|tara:strand:+ start:99 stop:773 length:675 start_codon:yes stop_codon:yes gene_type:complete